MLKLAGTRIVGAEILMLIWPASDSCTSNVQSSETYGGKCHKRNVYRNPLNPPFLRYYMLTIVDVMWAIAGAFFDCTLLNFDLHMIVF